MLNAFVASRGKRMKLIVYGDKNIKDSKEFYDLIN